MLREMTLKTLIRTVEAVAKGQPSVKMIIPNDVFLLNSRSDAEYGVFAWTQGVHTASADSSLVTYQLTLFYVDRLTADQGNRLDVQSTGIETLDNIIRDLAERGIGPGEYSFQTFNQRFLDECAGVYTTVSLTVPAGSLCPEGYDYDLNI